jgi:zinc/manganese transport system substrate-binding protein
MTMRILALPVAVLVVASLVACGSSSAAKPGTVAIAASTDVWGDIAKDVGGSAVTVTSIIDDPNLDPHEYEANPRDQLAVSRAAIVVENGGGYDEFMSDLAKKNASAMVVNAATVSGKNTHPVDGDFNEHLWYDFPTVEKVAAKIAGDLETRLPAKRAAIRARLSAFDARMAELEQQVAAIKAKHAGDGVAITEPVPLYLTASMGLVDKTARSFSSAIEDDTDVAPAELQTQLRLFSSHQVAVLAYNEQTVTSTTTQVLAAAKAAKVPVIGVRETLPSKTSYLAWMQDDLKRFTVALDG